MVRAKRELENKCLALEKRLQESEQRGSHDEDRSAINGDSSTDNASATATRSLPSASEIAANMALEEARSEAQKATTALAEVNKTMESQEQRLQRSLEEQRELAAGLRRSSESLAESQSREEASRVEAKAARATLRLRAPRQSAPSVD